MKYEFPKIQHLDDVRPAIEGRDEFIIAERDWGYVVNYLVVMPDTFPPVATAGGSAKMREQASLEKAIRRECRGLLFYPDGKIMARRLHKFFNVNERDETRFEVVDFTQPHVILEKLDGSMITPVVTEAGLRWGTKMGITTVSMGAEEFVARNPHYAEFAAWQLESGYTPIFEWISRKQRIVIDYPEDRLVLIACRNTENGAYEDYDKLKSYQEIFNIDVVKSYEGTAESMAHLMEETKATEGIEGWIIRFDDGHMLKVKGEWYLRIHKTKDNLTLEKNVVELLINDKMDDCKPFMMPEDRIRVEAFEADFWGGINDSVRLYENYFEKVLKAELDRKRFALEWMPNLRPDESFLSSYVFSRFNGKDPRDLIINEIKANVSTGTKVESVRKLFGGIKWNYQFNADA